MVDRYAPEQVGVQDGTQPAKMSDGGIVHAKRRCIRASLLTGTAQANGDRLYLGRLPIGAVVKAVSGNVDTSLGATVLSVGTTAAPTKYVNGRALTAVDTPTPLGPRASASAAAKLTAEEDVWLTIGTGGIAAAIIGTIDIEYTISA
ncbi:hypothetical protein [Sphingobium sp. YG1]|uniref:hypothetical protein n=1 Tax=Sphingobium sp. YG1 TaxID=2082188 RepID=UPI000DBB5C50|nr:hypothetical protein [Sphingobium sp. YG1]BBC99099.1 hypothetical protein YGS_C1P0355 [Sphingobium sp. YG1]